MAYRIVFASEEKKQFEILNDALRAALKPTSFDDCDVVLSIKNKIKDVSTGNEQKQGYLCSKCGSINTTGETTVQRVMKTEGATIYFEKTEYEKIKEALGQVIKPYDLLDEFMVLLEKFRKAEDKPASEWVKIERREQTKLKDVKADGN